MTRVNREEFISCLSTVEPGLTPREIIEQSSCFVFQKKKVMTFNTEIACVQKCPIDITGAVQAAPLMKLLQKMVEDEIEIEVEKDQLLVRGKKRCGGFTMEKEILLPIHKVEAPDNWKKLPKDFSEAVMLVEQCAGKDQSQFEMTCVHIAKNWMEACDNFQMTRYKIKTGLSESTLVKRDSLRHIPALDMTEISESESWLHFRNSSGLVMSCRRYVDEYPDIERYLQVEGEPTVIPKGLGDAADKAEIFSSENADNNQVIVEMRPGKLRIKGIGISGWYHEIKKIKYTGPSIKFLIAPQMLIELTKRHNECQISQESLKVNGDRFVYVTSLGIAGDKKKKEEVDNDNESESDSDDGESED